MGKLESRRFSFTTLSAQVMKRFTCSRVSAAWTLFHQLLERTKLFGGMHKIVQHEIPPSTDQKKQQQRPNRTKKKEHSNQKFYKLYRCTNVFRVYPLLFYIYIYACNYIEIVWCLCVRTNGMCNVLFSIVARFRLLMFASAANRKNFFLCTLT